MERERGAAPTAISIDAGGRRGATVISEVPRQTGGRVPGVLFGGGEMVEGRAGGCYWWMCVGGRGVSVAAVSSAWLHLRQ